MLSQTTQYEVDEHKCFCGNTFILRKIVVSTGIEDTPANIDKQPCLEYECANGHKLVRFLPHGLNIRIEQ